MNKKLVGSAVVGAAVLAVVAALIVGGGDAPAAAPPPSTTAAPAPGIQPGHLEVYRFPESAGGRGSTVSIPVPPWASDHVGDHATYTDPTGRFALETDRVPLEQEDPLSGLKALAKANHDPGYRLTSFAEHDPVDSYDTAEWDYTYQRQGETRQVREVGLGVGEVLITIRYDAPQAGFAANLPVLTEALKVPDAG
ncbi:hypothetical protein [Amycolatopsis australiensis]|uniref:Lipoprotein LpqN n=1 Tax=Amycolatopsis australiensis TaxID=546364 RepID=A0A1K1QQ54_9PSEU|nr:hypothetical protein [Amycolatopsis australiensis]SFW62063.1 hypothetical protein SAMN04489730_2081 [Amycolatopsis australiensis]